MHSALYFAQANLFFLLIDPIVHVTHSTKLLAVHLPNTILQFCFLHSSWPLDIMFVSGLFLWLGSVVEWFRAPFLWRPVIEVAGSTLNSITLLRPWERRFAIISSAWWILTSSKFLKVNKLLSIKNMELTTPKRVWINDPMYKASAAFP